MTAPCHLSHSGRMTIGERKTAAERDAPSFSGAFFIAAGTVHCALMISDRIGRVGGEVHVQRLTSSCASPGMNKCKTADKVRRLLAPVSVVFTPAGLLLTLNHVCSQKDVLKMALALAGVSLKAGAEGERDGVIRGGKEKLEALWTAFCPSNQTPNETHYNVNKEWCASCPRYAIARGEVARGRVRRCNSCMHCAASLVSLQRHRPRAGRRATHGGGGVSLHQQDSPSPGGRRRLGVAQRLAGERLLA